MNTSFALLDTINAKSLVESSGSSLSEYFATQFAALTPMKVVIALLAGFLVGCIVAFTYKKCYRGVLYSPNFALTLVMLTLITTPVVMCIKSDISLSMGMVGALSIVRFRTAIKEPLDIVFLFWAIAAGIIVAVGLIPLAVLGSLAIGVMLLTLANRSAKTMPYILVIHCADGSAEAAVTELIAASTARQVLKGKTFSANGSEELTIEVQLKNGESDFVRSLSALPGVTDVAMVSYNGDYMS